MNTRRCETCFFVEAQSSPDGIIGAKLFVCRKGPLAVIPVANEKGFVLIPVLRVTPPHEWCCEYKDSGTIPRIAAPSPSD